ncbi:hypothetical protein [Sulfurospirillum oryzae]|uniref:hypothetical protein n=1 Tax=Sulfurospirillum oryzae TaxID=2976535 RepID=UPI0021E8D868|nr:hypothetical protein [Sulfurospirillum oryzae]
MSSKELYQHTKQIQLNEWKTGMILFRTQALAARTHVQVELGKQVKILEGKLEEGKTKLEELHKASGSNFESTKKGFEITWESISSTFEDTAEKFKATA